MLMNVLRKSLHEEMIPEIKWRAVRVRSAGCGARGTPLRVWRIYSPYRGEWE